MHTLTHAQVKADCCFLQSLGVMDYSLLLGVHFRSRNNDNTIIRPPSPTSKSKVRTTKYPIEVSR